MKENEISIIQKQFWLIQKLYKDNTAYNIPVLIKFNGVPNLKALEYSVNAIIQRHEALRAFFYEEGDRIIQKIIESGPANLRIKTVEVAKPFDQNTLPEEVINEVNTNFNLNEWPLLRVSLFVFQNDVSVLSFIFHHIITDLRSKEIFAVEFSEFYNSYCGDYQPNIGGIAGKYSDFVTKSGEWLTSGEAHKMQVEWQKYLPQNTVNLEIPADFPRPRVNNLEGSRKHFTLGEENYLKVLDLAARNSVNPFTVMLTVYAIFLHRLTGQHEIVIGVPFTNRRDEEFRNTFGCFVNIVPLMVTFNDEITGAELLKQIRHSLLKIHRIQEVPFLILNDLLKNQGSNTIFRSGFTFEPPVNLTLTDLESSPLIVERNGSQLDLFLTLWEENNDLNGYMEYSSLLFREQTIARFMDLFKNISGSFLEKPDEPVIELNILTEEESSLIMKWNDTDHSYSADLCLHHKLELQAMKTPDSIAVLYGDKSMTYSEFNTHANRLANHLIDNGVKKGDIVCVCMERSIELLISLYSIHKAGAAYMPVDPEYPAERLLMMIEDALPRLILTKERCRKNLPGKFRWIELSNMIEEPLSTNEIAPDAGVRSSDLAYLLFTSGSTGKPKGVMIEHHSVVNKLEWMQFRHPMDQNDTIMLKTPVTFDVSVWELFWWTFNGARCAILPPGGEKEPGMIIDEVKSKNVTAIVFVPSMFSPFVGYIRAKSNVNNLKSLKWIIQIGEALSPQLVNSFNELLTAEFSPLIVNTYGPTEATVAVSWYDCPKTIDNEKIYIGKPIFNTKLLVVNKRNRIQPIGVPGELVITGVNLARGYLNRPELNAEKFIQLRYLDGRDIRAYRTGDLVKWAGDGNIEFIGRVDSQVKIRGYRIELGDIESKLMDIPAIKAAAVIVSETKPENKIIAAYVVLKTPDAISIDEIRKSLTSMLPDYMIPGYFKILGELPLNTSGKVDRKSLPSPDFISVDKIALPESQIERKLQEIWKEALGLRDLGVTRNFFDIGGNSLLAVHVVNAIRNKLNIDIEPLHIMEYPDIRSLARFISELNRKDTDESDVSKSALTIRKQRFSVLQKKRSEMLKKHTETN
ncbi:MAG: non-ribosomal peptide synthetase [Methanosarcina sp.]